MRNPFLKNQGKRSIFHKLVLYHKEQWQSWLSWETIWLCLLAVSSDKGWLLPSLETGWALDCGMPVDRRTLEQVAGNQYSVAGIIGRTGMEWKSWSSRTKQSGKEPIISFRLWNTAALFPALGRTEFEIILKIILLKFANNFKIKNNTYKDKQVILTTCITWSFKLTVRYWLLLI